MDLIKSFYDISPYDDFDPDLYPSDLQGWGSRDPVFLELIELIRPKIIVEVGTWKGASAFHMASITQSLGLDTMIICVDTWLGSPEHFLGQKQGWRDSLLLKNGLPHLYFTFLSNVIRAGFTERIVPLVNTSDNAAVILRAKCIFPDLVYIDAAHEEEPAYRDFHNYWNLLSENGVLFGDDYISWESVTLAANRFANDVQRPIAGKRDKFVIARKADVSQLSSFPGIPSNLVASTIRARPSE